MAQVLGLLNTLVGIVSFLSSTFPAQQGPATVVRIAAGLNGPGGLSGADGTIDQIQTFDLNQSQLGQVDTLDSTIQSGSFVDYTVPQETGDQATFIQVFGSKDAVCIAYIAVTWPDGSNYGWPGDWGKQCGLDWYPSNVAIPSTSYFPDCTWIDQDHTNGIKADMIMIDMPSFVTSDSAADVASMDPNSFCGYPNFRAYNNSDGTGSIFKARDTPAPSDGRLVISNNPKHNATEVCTHPNSLGPDFIATQEGDGVYCDMSARATLPLCSKTVTKDCYDLDSHRHITRRSASQKSYTDILTWDI